MTALDPALAALLRQDLTSFIQKVFGTVSPRDRYVPNSYVESIAYELERLLKGDTRRLLITQPPRTLKSICTSVAFVAWALGHNPSLSFICVSYSQDLALDLARMFRLVVDSAWYRALFPNCILQRDTDAEVVTTQRGGRLATSIGGPLTGKGGDIVIIDDPLKAEEAQSETARKRVKDWYSDTLLSRFDNPSTGRLILVMQRLHEDDLAGHFAPTADVHLNLPAIAIEPQSLRLTHGRVMHRATGDLLDPIRLTQQVLDRYRTEMGSFTFSAQYQQQPTPVDGNLIKRAWFKFYATLPSPEIPRWVQSWDVAVTPDGDYSVCTTWLVIGEDAYLANVWRGRAEFPDLLKQAIAAARALPRPTVLVEKAGLGITLYQTLRAENGVGDVIPIDPKGDKIERLAGESPIIEAGHVHLPETAPWLATLLHELLGFPNTKYDDQVDSVSQFLGWHRHHIARNAARGRTFAPVIIEFDR